MSSCFQVICFVPDKSLYPQCLFNCSELRFRHFKFLLFCVSHFFNMWTCGLTCVVLSQGKPKKSQRTFCARLLCFAGCWKDLLSSHHKANEVRPQRQTAHRQSLSSCQRTAARAHSVQTRFWKEKNRLLCSFMGTEVNFGSTTRSSKNRTCFSFSLG